MSDTFPVDAQNGCGGQPPCTARRLPKHGGNGDRAAMKQVINPNRGGVSRCLRTTYFKVSLANYLHDDGRAASGIIEIERL